MIRFLSSLSIHSPTNVQKYGLSGLSKSVLEYRNISTFILKSSQDYTFWGVWLSLV